MQSCCIRGCNSYKQTEPKYIGYFKFPLHDNILLENWLKQINQANLKPSEISQICSKHFQEKDLDRQIDKKYPRLLSTSIPTIFPLRRKINGENQEIVEEIESKITEELRISAIGIEGVEPHRNKVSLLRKKPTILVIQEDKEDGNNIELSNMFTDQENPENSVEFVSPDSLSSQEPFLSMAINKELDIPTSSQPIPFETIFLPYYRENIVASEISKSEKNVRIVKDNANSVPNIFSNSDHSAYSKCAIYDICENPSKSDITQYSNKTKLKDCPSPQINMESYTTTVLQDHIYSCPPIAKIRSVNSKSRPESNQLRKKLEDLRERRKREQLKIVRLQMHLNELEKKMKETDHEEIILPYLARGSKLAKTKSSWLIKEKEEYEKLLKDVREMKLKVLRERHDRESGIITSLQAQMTNLRKKMRENDQKEIGLSNYRKTNDSAVARPEWMKREEEEYEKLLQDVRKIKQCYNQRKTTNQTDSVTPESTKVVPRCEKILSDEDCTLIETMQKRSKLIEEIKNENNFTHKMEEEFDMNDDEYGEVIGEIDEESIHIDMSKEAAMLIFNEDLPDPGLLD